ncbi:MAG: cytochrome c biogenesis protein CcdA [Deltaproteobacteria bacterium]|jgi:cytochrome c-type biogenesis protein|nr:cytochrome c biogenesis protein CcdA [Deltaproteobacteria bacterium]
MLVDIGALGAIVTQKVTFWGAFLAGLVTFLTPCVLPMIPVWLALAFGPGQKAAEVTVSRSLLSTLFFILGFGAVFVALGAAASAFGSFLFERREILRFGGGIVMIAFGLSLLGVKLPFFSWLEGHKLTIPSKAKGLLGALVVGLAFAAGWTPCVGPVLGAILAMAALQSDVALGAKLLSVYSLGLGLPFLLIALLGHKAVRKLRGLGRFTVWLTRILGLLTIILGFLLIFNKINVLTFAYPY